MDDPAAADAMQEEIFRKRMALFDLSEKAGAAELDTVYKLMQYLVGEDQGE